LKFSRERFTIADRGEKKVSLVNSSRTVLRDESVFTFSGRMWSANMMLRAVTGLGFVC
jgi:hypothetical protein